MDTLIIDDGYIVPSLTHENRWFVFLNGGFEIELQYIETNSNRKVVYSTPLHWKTKRAIESMIISNDTFKLYKAKRKEIYSIPNG